MNISDAHVLIGTPNYTNTYSAEVYANHMQCNATWSKAGLMFRFQVEGRQFVHFARSRITNVALDSRKALEDPYTHILWLDDDALMQPETLLKYIEQDKDVIITPYPMRRPPHEVGILSATEYACPEGHVWKDESDLVLEKKCPECGGIGKRQFHAHGSYRNFTISDLDRGLVDVDGGGTHAMLVKTDVLTRIGTLGREAVPPLVREMLEEMTPEARDLMDHHIGDVGDPNLSFEVEDKEHNKAHFMMPRAGTEDMLWCYRAKCKGIDLFCDTDEWADHVGFAPVITRARTEAYEQIASDELEGREGIGMLKIGVEGRDHTLHDTTKEVSLG